MNFLPPSRSQLGLVPRVVLSGLAICAALFVSVTRPAVTVEVAQESRAVVGSEIAVSTQSLPVLSAGSVLATKSPERTNEKAGADLATDNGVQQAESNADPSLPVQSPAESPAQLLGQLSARPPASSGNYRDSGAVGTSASADSSLPGRESAIASSLQQWFGIEKVDTNSGVISGAQAAARIELPAAIRNRWYCQSVLSSELFPESIRNLGAAARAELVSGAIPNGLRLENNTVNLCGEATELGIFDFTLRIAISAGSRAINYRITVNESDPLSGASGPLELPEQTLASGILGARYVGNVRVSGGKPPYSFTATGLPNSLAIDGRSGLIGGLAEVAHDGTITVVVRDSAGQRASRGFALTIRPAPLSLSTTAIPKVQIGEALSFTFSAAGGTPPYSWQLLGGLLPRGLRFDSRLGTLTGVVADDSTAHTSQIGDRRLRIQVSDSRGGSDAAEFRLVVAEAKLRIRTGGLPDIVPSVAYQATIAADGGTPPYRFQATTALPDGFTLSTTSTLGSTLGLLSGKTESEWIKEIGVVVADAKNQTVAKQFTLKSTIPLLQIDTAELPAAATCGDYSQTIRASGGVPPYRFRLLESNEQLQIDSSGVLHGRPNSSQSIVVEVLDSREQRATKQFAVELANAEIKLADSSKVDCTANELCNRILSSNGGCAPYQYQVVGGELPAGLQLSAAGELSGTSTVVGDFSLEVRITDALQNTAAASVLINVAAGALTISTSRLSEAQVGVDYQMILEARGGEPPYIWGVEGQGLPNGFVLDSRTGEILGRPVVAGNYPIVLTLLDASQRRSERPLSLNVMPTALSVEGPADVHLTQGEAGLINFQALGGSPPYVWQFERDSNENSTAEIALSAVGVEGAQLRVVANELSDFRILLQVRDAAAVQAEKSINIGVTPATLRVVTPSPLVSGQVAVAYSVELQVQGGRPPYRFVVAAGSLPAGLSLGSDSGLISGTPLEEVTEQPFVVMVRDQDNHEARAAYLLSITGDERAGITQLTARASDSKVGLLWRVPNDSHFLGAQVIRKIGSYPQTVDDGTIVYSGTDRIVLDDQLQNNQSYYYSAFAIYDDGGVVAPTETGRAVATTHSVEVSGDAAPYADSVAAFSPLSPTCFGCERMPGVVLGPPRGGGEFNGSTDVVSLGARVNSDSGATAPYGGSITLSFDDNIIVDGPGVDFTVFENVFRAGQSAKFWLEPATVEVSADGLQFYRFPFDYVPHFDEQGRVDANNQAAFPIGFAGINPVYSNGSSPSPIDPHVSGGDSFDLANLVGVRLPWVRFVRITATGDAWMQDLNGDLVRHSNEAPTFSASGSGNSGFDLDAIAAINY